MEIKSFELVNREKFDRALNGNIKADGTFIGGIGGGVYLEGGVWKRDGSEISEKEVDTLETALLAEYDRLGGLIKKGGDKVKTGSFYNFKARKPHDTPQVTFVYKVNNKFVEVKEGIELPGEVKAAKILENQEKADQEESEEESEDKPKRKGKKSKEE